jgi:hypothetical protein
MPGVPRLPLRDAEGPKIEVSESLVTAGFPSGSRQSADFGSNSRCRGATTCSPPRCNWSTPSLPLDPRGGVLLRGHNTLHQDTEHLDRSEI